MRSAPLAGDVVTDGRGMRWTARVRTGVDLIRRGDLDEAVVLPRCRGSALARQAAQLADGLAESPQETRVRLILRRAELATPVAQFVVRSGPTFVARVDFAWPEHRLALEYDGLWHSEPRQFGRDRLRLNKLRALQPAEAPSVPR